MAFLKFLLKTFFNLFLLIVLFLVCILGLTVWIAPKLGPKFINTWIEGRTGFATSIQHIDIGLFSGTVNMENITLINPPYYQNKNFMQLKQFTVKTQLLSLLRPQTVFDSFFINIDKLTLVRNPENSLNIVEFANSFRKSRTFLETQSAENSDEAESIQTEKAKSTYLIKNLVVQLNSVTTVGFPNPEDSHNFTLDYHREFTNVTDIQEVIRIITQDIAINSVSALTQDLSPILNQLVNPKIQKRIQKVLNLLSEPSK